MNQADLDRIYAELPTIKCKGKCWPFCSPIRPVTTPQEWQRMVDLRGFEPEQTDPDLCPFLTEEGRCSVYSVRPPICRFYGIVESMVCPEGCKPKPRYLTAKEMHVALFRLRTGASRTEARRSIQALIDMGALIFTEASTPLTLRSWTKTEQAYLRRLRQEGRTEHIPPTALTALDLLDRLEKRS